MSGSRDLSPSENGWLPTKAYIRRFQHWEIDETQQLAKEGCYEQLKQQDINKWCDSIPERLQNVINLGGMINSY